MLCEQYMFEVEIMREDEAVKLRDMRIIDPFDFDEHFDKCLDYLPHYRTSAETLRTALELDLHSELDQKLRKHIMKNLLKKIDEGQPVEYVSEFRTVTLVLVSPEFHKTAWMLHLCHLIQESALYISTVIEKGGGQLSRIFMFEKGCMFLCVFGLPGDKKPDECAHALESSFSIFSFCWENPAKTKLVSISITNGPVFCGVVGAVARHEYTVIGPKVSLAARMITAYPGLVSCDEITYLRSMLPAYNFKKLPEKMMKNISNPGKIYEYLGHRRCIMFGKRHLARKRNKNRPLLDREKELEAFQMAQQRCLHQKKGQAVLYEGGRGYGKSQLLAEINFLTQKEGHRVLPLMLKEADSKQCFYAIQTPMAIFFEIDTCPAYYRQECLQRHLRGIVEEQLHCLFNDLLFVKAARETPLIFLIDEAQYMDAASWEFLETLLYSMPIIMVMTLTPIFTLCGWTQHFLQQPSSYPYAYFEVGNNLAVENGMLGTRGANAMKSIMYSIFPANSEEDQELYVCTVKDDVNMDTVLLPPFLKDLLQHLLPGWDKNKLLQVLRALVDIHVLCWPDKSQELPAEPILVPSSIDIIDETKEKKTKLVLACRCGSCHGGDFVPFHRFAVCSTKNSKGTSRFCTYRDTGSVLTQVIIEKLQLPSPQDSFPFQMKPSRTQEAFSSECCRTEEEFLDQVKRKLAQTSPEKDLLTTKPCHCKDILKLVLSPLTQHCLVIGETTCAFYYLLEAAAASLDLSDNYMAFFYLRKASSLLGQPSAFSFLKKHKVKICQFEEATFCRLLSELYNLEATASSYRFACLATLMQKNSAEEFTNEAQLVSTYVELSQFSQSMGIKDKWLYCEQMAIQKSSLCWFSREGLLATAQLMQTLAYTKLCLGHLDFSIKLGFQAREICRHLKKPALENLVLSVLFRSAFLKKKFGLCVHVLESQWALISQGYDVLGLACFYSACLDLLLYGKGLLFQPFSECLRFVQIYEHNRVLTSHSNVMLGVHSSLAMWFAQESQWDLFEHYFSKACQLVKKTNASLFGAHGFVRFLECHVLMLQKIPEGIFMHIPLELRSQTLEYFKEFFSRCVTCPVSHQWVSELKASVMRCEKRIHVPD
ncbi:hypothetical protein H8959_010541 [Pygathrix nigripes]